MRAIGRALIVAAAAVGLGLAVVPAHAGIGATVTFTPDRIALPQASTLRVVLSNTDNQPATALGVSHSLPPGLVVAPFPNLTNTCGGAVALTPGGTTLALTGGVIPGATGAGPGKCVITVDVVTGSPGTFVAALLAGAVTSSRGNLLTTVQATLGVTTNAPILGTKTFSPDVIHGEPSNDRGESRVTITLTNPNDFKLTGLQFTDTLPAGLVIGRPPQANTSCKGGRLDDPNPGDTSVTMTDGELRGGESCTVRFDVTVDSVTASVFHDEILTNTIPADAITANEGVTSATISADVRIQTGAQVIKTFEPATITSGDAATLTLEFRNYNLDRLTSITLTDLLPDPMRIASPAHADTTCDRGQVDAIPGLSFFSFTDGQVDRARDSPGFTSCTVTVSVTAVTSSDLVLTNQIPAHVFDGISVGPASADLTVTAPHNVTAAKVFTGTAVQSGVLTLIITLKNTAPSPAFNTSLTDNLTTMGVGYTVAASPAATTTCGGILSAPPGATTIALSNGIIPAGGTCTVTVPVQIGASATLGTRVNTIPAGAIQSSQGATTTEVTASVNTVAALGVSKAFSPATVVAGRASRLTITVTHAAGAAAFSNLSFTDTLPAGHGVAATPGVTNTCGGAVTAGAGAGTVSLAGGALGAGPTTCSVAVNVTTPAGSGSATNTLAAGAVTTAQGVTNGSAASATLVRIQAEVVITKAFTPAAILAGGTSTSSVNIANPSALNLTGGTLSDQLPAGLVVATPPAASFTGAGCTGAVTAVAGDQIVSLTGAGLVSGSTCVLAVNVTASQGGSLTNTIAAGTFFTAQGVTNATAASAVLTVTGSADLAVAKILLDPVATPGTVATYQVTITNAGPSHVAGATVTDNAPAGTQFVEWTCASSGGATCTALGSGNVLDTVTIPAGDSVRYVVSAAIDSGLTGSLANTATVAPPATVVDPNPGNNTSTVTVTLTPAVTLGGGKVDGTDHYTPGASQTYFLVVTNAGPSDAKSVTVSETLPPGVTLTGSVTCTAAGTALCGTVTGSAGGTALGTTGASIPAGSGNRLTFTVPVVFAASLTTDPLVNTVTATDVGTSGPGSSMTRSDTDARQPQLTLAVGVTDGNTTYAPGGTATYTVTVTNTGVSNALGLSVGNPLPAGVTLTGTVTCVPSGAATCGTVSGAAGGTSFGISGATLNAGAANSLVLAVPVAFGPSLTANPLVVTATATDLAGGAPVTGGDSNALRLDAIAVNKSFTPDTVASGQTSTLTVLLLNLAPDPATGTAFTDTLPTGVTIASPASAGTTCGGSLAATPGGGSLSLSGGTIPPKSGDTPGQCQVTVSVVSSTIGSHVNTLGSGAVTSSKGPNTEAAQATLSVPTIEPMAGTKTFVPANLHGNGGPATVTITLVNNNPVSLTGVAFTDALPATVVVASPAKAATSCGAGVVSAATGSGTVSLANGSLGPNSSCTVTFDVIASPSTSFVDATRVNTIAGVTSTQGATAPAFSAIVRVQTGARVTKAFSPAIIANGGITTVTFTIRNLNASPLTPLTSTDALPAGMTIANPPAAVTTCPGASLTANPGATSVSLSGGTLDPAPAGIGFTSCTNSVNVTAVNAGTAPIELINTLPGGSFGAVTYGPTSASLVVTPLTTVSGAKAFSPGSAVQTRVSALTITLSNASPTAASIATVSDNLATMGAGFTVASSPAATTTCGGIVTAAPGATTISMTGGTIPALGSCQIVAPVQVGPTAPTGTRTNTIAVGGIQTNQGGNGTAISGSLTVSAALTVSKAFVPTTIAVGGVTRLTITLTHVNGAVALSNLGVTDTLPAAHVVAPTPGVTNTCGGTVTATAGSGSISLAGGALAAGATSCQIAVNVTVPSTVPSGTAATATNTIPAGAVTTAEGVSNATAASASVTRTLAFLTLGKSFVPLAVAPGGVATVTITIANTNPGAVPLAGVSVTDVFPVGLTIANPPNASLTGTGCTGIVGAVAGGTTLSLSGGTIAAGAQCELKADVTPTAVDTLVNGLPAGAVTTTQGVTNPSQVVATVVSIGRADLRVQKTASAPSAAPGGALTYTITVSNAGPDDITGASFADAPPAGATFPSWTCAPGAGAACTAAGSGAISDAVTLPEGSSVVYTVNAAVAPGATGSIVNTATVRAPTLIVDPDETNNSVTVTTPITPPVLKITKSATPASFALGTPASYAITVVNNGPVATTAVVTVTDNLPATLTPGTMPPGCGAAGNNVTCTIPAGLASEAAATFVIPVTPIATGQAINTATVSGGGDPGCPQTTARCQATVTTTIGTAQLRVIKEAVPISFVLGVPARYTLTVVNEGTQPATAAVTVTDTVPESLLPGVMPAGCASLEQQVTCTIPPPLPAGAGVTFVIPVTPTASGSIVNTATISGGGDPSCPSGAPDRCQSTVTTAVGAPQLRISKQAAPTSFVVGVEASYELTVVNEGTAPTTAVSTIADHVPDSFTLGTLPSGCTATLHDVTCTIPAGLAPGLAVSFIISVTPRAAGTFVNTAAVSGGGDHGCPQDTTRCSATVATAVDRPQLRLHKEATPESFTVGVEARYVLTVVNEGTAATTDVSTVADSVPGAFTLGAMAAGCVATGQEVRCTIAAGLVSGGSVAFIVPVTPTASGSFVNTATVTGGGDPSCPPFAPARCSATITTAVGEPHLRVVKRASPASFVVGAAGHYVITVVNEGTAATTAPVIVADNVPASLTLGAMPAGCVASGQQVTCTIPAPLAPGTPVIFEIPVTPTVGGQSVVNTAAVAGGGDSGCPLTKTRCASSVTTAIEAAQLRLTKEATPPSFSVGVAGTYLLRVVNEGTAHTTAVARVVDNVPATFAIGDLPSGCLATGQQVACLIPAGLEPGGAVSFSIPVTPSAGGAFANSARVIGGGDPGCLPASRSRCEATIVTTVGAPQLRIAKEATPPSFTVNVAAGYTLTVFNDGHAPTTALAIVADNIPSSLTLGALPAGCSAVGHALRCTVPTGLGAGASASFVIPVTPTVTGVPVTNTATLSGGGDPGCEPTVGTRCEITISTAVDGPQLRLTKSLAGSLVVNVPASYTMSVVNEGTAATTRPAVVVDVVPLTFTLGALPPGCTAVLQTIACAIPAGLAPGATANFVIPVTPGVSGSFFNSARVGGGGDPGCPPAGRTRCESSIPMNVAGPRLQAIKQAPASFVVGVPASYTIGVVNQGDATTTGPATITDEMPASLTLGVMPAGCSAVAQLVTCTVPAGLAPETSSLFAIPVTATVGGSSLSNTAAVSGGGDPGCPNPSRPRCRATVVTPVGTASLVIDKQAVPSTFTVGTSASYVITVTNQGTTATPAPAAVTDDLPASFTPGTMPPGCTIAASQVTCTIPPGLAPGASATFVIPVTPTVASASTSNSATLGGAGAPGCPAASGCSSTVVTTIVSPVVGAPRLRVTKEAPAPTANPGVPFDYVITVTNEGTAPTTAVATVSDTVPAELALGVLPPDCTAVAQTVSCTVAAPLAAGGQVVFVIPVTLTVASPSLSNTATVAGGGDSGCPGEARCASTVVTSGDVGPSSSIQLRLTKTASPPTFTPGQPGSFTLTVTNEGTAPTTDPATVVDELPADVTLVGTPAGCTALGQVVTCTVAPGLAPGSSVSFVLPIVVGGNVTATTLRNQAAVSGGGDPGCPAEPRCNAQLDVPIATTPTAAAIPVLSPAMLLAIAVVLAALALWRLRRSAAPRT